MTLTADDANLSPIHDTKGGTMLSQNGAEGTYEQSRVDSKLSKEVNENIAVVSQLVPVPKEEIEWPGTPANLLETRRRRASTVSLVIPTKNEARNLSHVLERIPDIVDEVILVDGRSSDVSTLMAKSCRPDLRIIMEPSAGKGCALRAGFNASSGDLIIAMDADGSMSPEEIPQYVHFLENGFDLVKGSRFIAGGDSLDITPLRRAGNRALLRVANLFYEVKFTDLCYGFFGFRRIYLPYLDLNSTGFEIETEIMVRASLIGLRIAEIPSLELPRRHGGSNLHAIKDGQRVLKTILTERFLAASLHRMPADVAASASPLLEP